MTEASQTETVEKHRELASAHDRTTEERPGSATIGVGIASGLQFRIDERYEVDGEAEVAVRTGSLGTTMLRGSILDISSTGCYIQSMARVPIKPGTEVHLIFSVGGTTFRLEAVSRFSRTKVGIGFRFLEMDAPTRVRLHGVLADLRSKGHRRRHAGPVPSSIELILD